MLIYPNPIFRAEEEHMDIELTKRGGTSTKRGGTSTKGQAEDMIQTYSSFGAYGDYVVTMPDGEKILYSAVTVRVLDRGVLNLATDTGQWFLFVADQWSKVAPAQPRAGKVTGGGPN
jgi:hypothetical protein